MTAGEVDGVSLAEILDRGREVRRLQRAQPARQEFVEWYFSDVVRMLKCRSLRSIMRLTRFFARDDLLERKPPGLAEAVGKRRRHIDRERNADGATTPDRPR